MNEVAREKLGRVAYEARMNCAKVQHEKKGWGELTIDSWQEQDEGIREQNRVAAEAVVMTSTEMMLPIVKTLIEQSIITVSHVLDKDEMSKLLDTLRSSIQQR